MKLFAIDPGNTQSGVVIFDKTIMAASIMLNKAVMEAIKEEITDDWVVVIEDIKPYSTRMSQSVVDTIKFVGALEHELARIGRKYQLINRWEVKKWIFDNFKTADERVRVKIDKKGVVNNDGSEKKTSFVYVDDRIVIACMKEMWSIPTPKPGRKSLYGLSTHSWQALALISLYIAVGGVFVREKKSKPLNRKRRIPQSRDIS